MCTSDTTLRDGKVHSLCIQRQKKAFTKSFFYNLIKFDLFDQDQVLMKYQFRLVETVAQAKSMSVKHCLFLTI